MPTEQCPARTFLEDAKSYTGRFLISPGEVRAVLSLTARPSVTGLRSGRTLWNCCRSENPDDVALGRHLRVSLGVLEIEIRVPAALPSLLSREAPDKPWQVVKEKQAIAPGHLILGMLHGAVANKNVQHIQDGNNAAPRYSATTTATSTKKATGSHATVKRRANNG